MFVKATEKSRLFQLIEDHYTVIIPPAKSQLEISREEWLIPGVIRFSRWHCIPAAFLIQFCRQFLFCWSIFNKPVDTLIYGTSAANMAPLTFYIFILIQGLSAALMGPWLERHGPQAATTLGAALFCAGCLLTALALSLGQMWLVYLGYGCIVGCSIGICVISPVSTLQKWFPDHRGLASGVAVWGVAFGTITNVKLGMYFMNTFGLQHVFLIVGLVYSLLVFIAGLVLRSPPPEYIPEGHRYDMQEKAYQQINRDWMLMEALTSLDFWLIYAAFFANVLFGLVSMSTLSSMLTDIFEKTPEQAATVIVMEGIFGLLSYVIVPVICERIDKKNVYILSLSLQLVVLASFYFVLTSHSYPLFLMSMWTVAVCYGGGYGTISVFLTEKFGVCNVGPLFGIMVTTFSLVGIFGGILSTVIFQSLGNMPGAVSTPYYVNAWWMLVVVFVGWISALCIKPIEKNFVI